MGGQIDREIPENAVSAFKRKRVQLPDGTYGSLARKEAREAELKRERRQYEGRQQQRRHAVANLAEEWDKPDFTMEQKQAAMAETLAAVIIKPVGRGIPFHPDHIGPVFREATRSLIRPA